MKVIGLISGTSIDGIDAASVEITGQDLNLEVQLLNAQTYPYPTELKEQIIAVCHDRPLSIAQLAHLDDAIACQFAIAAQTIQAEFPTAKIIGSHGQTVYHRPPISRGQGSGVRGQGLRVKNQESDSALSMGYSMQLGRGEVIANLTGIPTVSNFRVADIAAGGHGAPLVSKVDVALLSHQSKHRAIQNLGGIGNLTYLPPRSDRDWTQKIRGWDTGPANVLIDLAIEELTEGEQTYDRNGESALRGKPCQKLVRQWLEQDYFLQHPPKSTGRELFNRAIPRSPLARCTNRKCSRC